MGETENPLMHMIDIIETDLKQARGQHEA